MSEKISTESPSTVPMEEKILAGVKASSVTNSADLPSKEESYDVPIEDPKAERALTLKMDIRIVPILGCIFMISFLSRTNIANARIQGLEAGLGMPSNGYNTCLWIFYLSFFIVEIPSNLIMASKWMRPNWWLGGQMFVLGVVAMCQGLTQSYGGLLACRFFMGIMEAGLPSGAALLLGAYYCKNELPLRFAIFFAFALLGNCFSGLLAYGLVDLGGAGGYAGWRWIFIVEGLMCSAFGVIAYFVVPQFPDRATWLKPEEKARLMARLFAERGNENEEMKGVNWVKVVTDYKIWLFTLMFVSVDMGASSISGFTPTILTQLGWVAKTAQIMSMPIWISGIVVNLVGTFLIAKVNMRWPFVLFGLVLSIVGWTIELVQVPQAGVRYFALFCIADGTFLNFPVLMSWLTGNLRGRAYLSVATALQLGLGQQANFISSNVFITTEAPKYPTGFLTGLIITVFAAVLLFITMGLLMWHNKKYDAMVAARTPDDAPIDETKHFRYIL